MPDTPAPVPSAEYIDALLRAVNAGAITWDELRALQTNYMPRCAAHDTPAVGRWEGAPICEACLKEKCKGWRDAG